MQSLKKLVIKKSNINGAGFGLFIDEDVKKGELVLSFSNDSFLITKEVYDSQQKDKNGLMIETGCRYVDNIFLYTDSRIRYENFINHAFFPNLLYHVGACFAKTNINKGDELTIDYRYILSENDSFQFVDSITNQLVIGYAGKESLVKSTKELLDILEEN